VFPNQVIRGDVVKAMVDVVVGKNGAPYEPSFFEKCDIREILEALSANESAIACDNSRSSGANRGDCCDAIHACVAGFAVKMPLKLSRY
jgi:hypothetical protein